MTRDEIILMAEEAGFGPAVGWGIADQQFANFAALVAAAEREACAKICDERKEQSRNSLVRSGLAVAAADIRSRGEL